MSAIAEPLNGIHFERVSFDYPGQPVLNNVSFEAPSGMSTVLFGPSGAGKTTILRLLAGLERPHKGSIRFGERTVASGMDFVVPKKRSVGLSFQEPALWPALSVRRHLELALSQNGIAFDPVERIGYLIDRYRLSGLEDRYPAQLSGGERKRVDFARAVAAKPQVVLLDEPLSSVEAPLRMELAYLIEECKSYGSTVVVVTHHLEELFSIAGHLVLMNQGEIIQTGEPDDVWQHPISETAARLLGYRNIFTARLDNAVLFSRFGEYAFAGDVSHKDGEWLAACMQTDLAVTPSEHGCAMVETCIPFERQFRVGARFDRDMFHAICDRTVVKGQPVDVQFVHPPVLLHLKEP